MTLSDQDYIEIEISGGLFMKVSPHRKHEFSQHRWTRWFGKSTQSWYACRQEWVDDKPVSIKVHRQILGLSLGDKRIGDHINGDTLDNRDSNLRIADYAQSSANRKRKSNNTSGYKGVSFAKNVGKWKAEVVFRGKHTYLGLFTTKESAYEAYCRAAQSIQGEFARLE